MWISSDSSATAVDHGLKSLGAMKAEDARSDQMGLVVQALGETVCQSAGDVGPDPVLVALDSLGGPNSSIKRECLAKENQCPSAFLARQSCR